MFTAASIPLLLLAAPAPALPTLQWKFREGDTFTLRTQTKAKAVTTVMGNEIASDQETIAIFRYTVKTVKRDGGVVLELKIDDLSCKITSAGTENKGAGRPLRGASLTVTLDPQRRVT